MRISPGLSQHVKIITVIIFIPFWILSRKHVIPEGQCVEVRVKLVDEVTHEVTEVNGAAGGEGLVEVEGTDVGVLPAVPVLES